jgi:hypothetical protein
MVGVQVRHRATLFHRDARAVEVVVFGDASVFDFFVQGPWLLLWIGVLVL